MTAVNLRESINVIKDAVTALAVLVGGGWAVAKFILRREAHPKVQFDLDLNVIGRFDSKVVIELTAIIENKGLVRHAVSEFTFSLLHLPGSVTITDGDERIEGQVEFMPLIKKRSWLGKNDVYTFVDPGVIQRYSYITHLPVDAALALLHSRFRYRDAKSDFHSAQRVFNVTRDVVQIPKNINL